MMPIGDLDSFARGEEMIRSRAPVRRMIRKFVKKGLQC